MGTALNKILMSLCELNKWQVKILYVPGWDCHGLPIEWKIEEEYRKKVRTKMMSQLYNLEMNAGICREMD